MTQVQRSLHLVNSDVSSVSYYKRPEASSSGLLSSAVLEAIFDTPQFEEAVSQIVESEVANNLLRQSMLIKDKSNPFDSIYLSELEPDSVHQLFASVETDAARTITDLSDTIMFNDGLDD